MPGYFSSIAGFYRQRPAIAIVASAGAFFVGDQSFKQYIEWSEARERRRSALNTSSFTPYTLICKTPVSNTSSIFTLRPPKSAYGASELQHLWDSTTSLFSVQAKQPQLQIGREYTPIPPTAALAHPTVTAEDADLHLLIRKEKNGEMTTYLHSLNPNDTIHLRGPYHDVRIPSHVTDVLFLAGGTGISPALQVAHIMSRRQGARTAILWANRRREECMGAVSDVIAEAPSSGVLSSIRGWLGGAEKKSTEVAHALADHEKGAVVRVLEEMKQRAAPSSGLTVQYFVDEEDRFIGQKDVNRILQRPSTIQEQRLQLPPPTESDKPGAKLIIVSGPDGFVDYWAGRKRWDKSGKEIQGPLKGVLGEMDLKGWKVWKL